MPSSQEPSPKKPILIAFYCNKGGVGKTTLVHNLAYILAEHSNLRVLAVDADPQCNLSNQLLKTPPGERLGSHKDPESLVEDFYFPKDQPTDNKQRHIYDCFRPILDANASDSDFSNFMARAKNVLIRDTVYENLKFLPGHIDFEEAAGAVAGGYRNPTRENVAEVRAFAYLTNYIREIASYNNIDVVLIDLNPGINILNANFLIGSDYFFIPTIPDCFTRQGVHALSRKFPEWVERMAPFRDPSRNPEIRLGPPAKFLGYVSLRFPTHAQSGSQPDVVKAYHKWWEKIEADIQNQLIPALERIQGGFMLTPNFHLFKIGVKNFASQGENLQVHGIPIADTKYSDAKTNPKMRSHFFAEFHRLAFKLLSNLSPEDLDQLGYADTNHFRLSAPLFGAVAYDDIDEQFQDNENNIFSLSSSASILKSGNFFAGLPIPFNHREIYKRLEGNLKVNDNVINHLAHEMIEFFLLCLEHKEPLPSFILSRTTDKILNLLKQLLNKRRRNPDEPIPVELLNACKPKLHQYLAKYFQQIKGTEPNDQFSFNFIEDTITINPHTHHLLFAIMKSLNPDEQFELVLYNKDEDDRLQKVFHYIPVLTQNYKTLRLFIEQNEDQAHAFRLLLPKSELQQKKMYQQSNNVNDRNHWYTADEINQLLDSIIPNEEVHTIAAMHPFIQGQYAEHSQEIFVEQIKEALERDIPTYIPINTVNSEIENMQSYIGTHWVGLIIVPPNDDNPQAQILEFDPLNKHERIANYWALLGEHPDIINNVQIRPVPLHTQIELHPDCGAWVVAYAERYANNHAGVHLDPIEIEDIREAHHETLRNIHIANAHQQEQIVSSSSIHSFQDNPQYSTQQPKGNHPFFKRTLQTARPSEVDIADRMDYIP